MNLEKGAWKLLDGKLISFQGKEILLQRVTPHIGIKPTKHE